MKKSILCFALTLICAVTFAETPDLSSSQKPVLIDQTIAIINQASITQSQLDSALKQTKMQIAQNGLTAPDTLDFKQHVLQHLILQTIALQLAQANHIEISDSAVDQAIVQVLEGNHANLDQLKQMLARYGLTMDQYRNTIRTELTINRLEQAAVSGTILVSPTEIDQFLALQKSSPQNQVQYHLAHILIAPPANPTPEELKTTEQKTKALIQKIQTHQMTFSDAAIQYSEASDANEGGDMGEKTKDQLPNLFADQVSQMKAGDVVGPIQDANGFHILTLIDLKTQTAAPKNVTEYQVNRILIKNSPVINDERAKALLTHLKDQIQHGSAFATVASENTDDTITKAQGGSLGFLSLSQLQEPLKTVVLKAAPNTVSEPFKTADGWQIVMVSGTRQTDYRQQDEREAAAQTLFQQKAETALQTWQEKVRGEAYVKVLLPELDPQS